MLWQIANIEQPSGLLSDASTHYGQPATMDSYEQGTHRDRWRR